MFAKYLYREGIVPEGAMAKPWLQFLALRSMDEVWEALSALDGDELSNLIVSEGPGNPEDDEYGWSGKSMLVAGGEYNRYYCEAYDEDRTRVVGTKRNVTRSTETVPMAFVEDVWAHQIIGIDEAREALAAFAERGELSSALAWEREP